MQIAEDSFKGFYKEYYRYVFSVVATYVPLKEDAEDVIAEVFISLFKIYSQLDSAANIKALIFTITKRRINDFLRKKYKLKEHEIFIEDLDKRAGSIDDEVENFTTNKRPRLLIKQLVLKLKQRYRNYYELKYKERLTNEQIGEKMGITENNVKVLNTRLITKLKTLWMRQNKEN